MLIVKIARSILAPALLTMSFTNDFTFSTVWLDTDTPPSHTQTSRSSPAPVVANAATTKSPTEDYLPRRLYPGTYQNYCGPTPEISLVGGCVAHGWHGDEAVDAVDAACRLHDVSYCKCEAQLVQRRQQRDKGDLRHNDNDNENDSSSNIPMLSALTALRFATRPALPVDAEYFQCITKADKHLIATGLQIRGEQQQSACTTGESALRWFCHGSSYTGSLPSAKGDTLSAFEQVNLNIFLKSLDSDNEHSIHSRQPFGQPSSSSSLSALEKQRRLDMKRELASGKSLAQAAASPAVVRDEQEMLQRLAENEQETALDGAVVVANSNPGVAAVVSQK